MSDEYVKRKDVLAMFSQSRTISQAMDGFMRLPSADVVEAERPKGEWIPCEERLPEAEYGESDIVLAYTEDGLYRILYFDGGNWCYPTGECFEHAIHPVIAWMPLPEPYHSGEATETVERSE